VTYICDTILFEGKAGGYQTVTYDGVDLNLGLALEVDAGVFRAPVPGVYFFATYASGSSTSDGNTKGDLTQCSTTHGCT
jgi:hypothetical protein